MGHAQNNLFDHPARPLFRWPIQQRDQAFAALEGKAFGADEFLADELLERDRVGQAGEDADLFLARQFQAVAGAFHAFLQPAANAEIVNVHVLHADGAAVSVAQLLEDLANGEGAIGLQGLAMNGPSMSPSAKPKKSNSNSCGTGRGRPRGSTAAMLCPRTR